MLVKLGIISPGRDENKKYLKPPPRKPYQFVPEPFSYIHQQKLAHQEQPPQPKTHFAKDTSVTSASGKTVSLVTSSKGLEGSGSAGASAGASGATTGFIVSDVLISIFSGEVLGLLSSLPFLSSAFVPFLQEGFDLDLDGVDFGAGSASTSVTVTFTGGFACGVSAHETMGSLHFHYAEFEARRVFLQIPCSKGPFKRHPNFFWGVTSLRKNVT